MKTTAFRLILALVILVGICGAAIHANEWGTWYYSIDGGQTWYVAYDTDNPCNHEPQPCESVGPF